MYKTLLLLSIKKMSALDFANSFAQALQPQPNEKIKKQEKQEKKEKLGNQKFTHSPNVIMKRGTYKAYYGFVKRFVPGVFQVQFQEQQNVPVHQYGDQPVGSTILTVFGNSTITNRLPILFGIKANSAGKSELFFTESQLTKVVTFKDENGAERLGQFFGSSDNGTCEVGLYEIDKVDELSRMYRSGDTPMVSNKTSIECSQITSKIFIVSSRPSNPSDTNFTGIYGPLTRTVPEQYVITYPKTVYKNAKGLVSFDGKKPKIGTPVTIKSGPYKGTSAIVVGEEPPQLAIFIDAVGREIMTHTIKEGDNYREKPVTPDDVFYMDVTLKSSNDDVKYAQVVKLLDDGAIIGIVREPGGDYVPKKISADLIESYQPGFKFESSNSSEPEDLQADGLFVSEPETQQTDNTDDEEDVDNPDVEGFGEEERDRIEEEEPKFTSTYKDSERTSFAQTTLTSEQAAIKSTIDSILNFAGYDVDVYTLINNVESCFKHLKKQVGSLKKGGKYWKSSDEKYIIACLVLYAVVRSGYTHTLTSHEGDRIGNFLRELQTHKLFNQKDINGSIFLSNGWSDEFTVDIDTVQALHSSRNYDSIYRIMFENCNAVMQKLFGPVNVTTTFSLQDLHLIPLGLKRNSQKFVTVTSYINGQIPPGAVKILFGQAYQDILDTYKQSLVDAVNNNASSTSKKVYSYILENVERMPFALKELKADFTGTSNKLTKLKFEKMLQLWKMLLVDIKSRYQNEKTLKDQRRTELDEEREKGRKRRAEAPKRNSLADQLEELNLEDDDIVDKKSRKEIMQELTNEYRKMNMNNDKEYRRKKQKTEPQPEEVENASTIDISKYTPLIRKILQVSDLQAVSAKKVRRQMEAELGVSMESIKGALNELVEKVYDEVATEKKNNKRSATNETNEFDTFLKARNT